MNKSELIDAIASSANLTKSDAGKALEATVHAIETALKNGDKVALVGFGAFSVTNRPARTGRNPKTGEELRIEAKKVVKFKPGSELGKKIN